MKLTRRSWLNTAAALPLVAGLGSRSARAAEPIKIGILHSLSGTMAISETILKDLMLMQVADLNAQGGLLGRPIEAVVVDPASNWPLFAEKARELISKDKVVAVFGCWTSVSRKSVLPVFEELNGLLFYPLEYEGEEQSNNIFYGSSVPDNKAIPALRYLMSADGGSVKRFVLEGTDYVYPRTSNTIMRAFLKAQGVADADILENRGRLHDQWRRERAVLQGAGQSGHQGDGHSGDRILGRRGGTGRDRHEASGRSPGRVELLPVGQHAGKRGLHQALARVYEEPEAGDE